MSGQCGLNLFLNPTGHSGMNSIRLIYVPVVLLAPACFDDFGCVLLPIGIATVCARIARAGLFKRQAG